MQCQVLWDLRAQSAAHGNPADEQPCDVEPTPARSGLTRFVLGRLVPSLGRLRPARARDVEKLQPHCRPVDRAWLHALVHGALAGGVQALD